MKQSLNGGNMKQIILILLFFAIPAQGESLKPVDPIKQGSLIAQIKKGEKDLAGADLRGANLINSGGSPAFVLPPLTSEEQKKQGILIQKIKQGKKDLAGADLRRAMLNEADLTGADLRQANLYKANLTGANLQGAKLYKANLYKTTLRRANLQMQIWYGLTCIRQT